VTRRLRLTEEHVQRFAAASGDRNPLHVDELFARRTPYGRCIAHGALVTIAALGSADPGALRHVRELDLRFRQPVFPEASYTVSCSEDDADRTQITVAAAGQVVAVISVIADRAGPSLPAVGGAPNATPRSPRNCGADALPGRGVSVSERYGWRPKRLRALAIDVGAGSVPDTVLTWLSAASYTVGMLIPGRDAVFAGGRIVRSSSDGGGTLRAEVATADDRTGLVIVQAALDQAEASARMTLQTFVRSPVPAPDPTSIARHLPASRELEGRNVLVVGASRGLGAALCGAFAAQEATVWAGFARSAEQADRLRDQFGAERIRPLRFDAGDVHETGRAFEALRSQAGTLDGVVLCAAPPLQETALQPDASEGTLQFVQASLAMTLVPLAEALRLLSPQGWIVFVSSSALEDPPEGWPHYVMAKAALEGAAAYCARHSQGRVVVVRPPRMWTDSTNTPLARLGAAAPEEVAAAIVRELMSDNRPSGALLLGADELLAAPSR
jgi:NAD(P)-dependent dehydrogenase (short-subunit alcohol dehydrogenase family)/acyl dehydratase